MSAVDDAVAVLQAAGYYRPGRSLAEMVAELVEVHEATKRSRETQRKRAQLLRREIQHQAQALEELDRWKALAFDARLCHARHLATITELREQLAQVEPGALP